MGETGHFGPAATEKRIRRHVSGRIRDYFAITTPGLEDICRQELVGLGLDCSDRSPVPGGVSFKGRFVDCQRSNLFLRTVTRILMRVVTFTATNSRQLKQQCSAVPWELFVQAASLPDIKVNSRRSRLYHSELIADSIREGLVERLGTPTAPQGHGFPQVLFVRLADDQVTLSLDSSGEPLYKRGLKEGPARAPIRETLAAAILMAAGYDGQNLLVDPMCGSGTFSLEAAMMAKRMAPGGRRAFAFMGWPAFRENQWAYLKREAEDAERRVERHLIFASDIDAEACRRLAHGVADNGLSDAVRAAQKDFFESEGEQYGSVPGLVVVNPPYGVRLGSIKAAEDLFGRICLHLKKAFKGWDVALIAPERRQLKAVPFSVRQVSLLHGGLKLTLCIGKIKK